MANATLIEIEKMLKHHDWVEECIGFWTHVDCGLSVDVNSSIAMVRSDSNSRIQMLDMEESTPMQARRFINEISNW
jgi:hypothetical protein